METSLFATSKSKIFAFLLLFILLYTSKETTAQCSVYGSSPSSCSFSASGGSQTVTLFLSGSGCTNYCSNPLGWLSVQNTGQGVFSLTASANTGAARSGSITFDIYTNTSYTLNVSQESGCTIATVGATQNLSGTLVSGSLGGNTPTVGTGVWNQVSGPGTTTFSVPTSGTSTATATAFGTYVYQWTISNGTCTPSTAQVTVNYYALIPRALNADMNYIQSRTILKDNVISETNIDALAADDLQETITYFDGLGRPRQTVLWQASPSKKDIVVPIGYDDFGREDKKYLPYALITANNGAFTEADFAGQSEFYTGLYDADGPNAFSITEFEPSPLNRVLKQGAPGSVWQPNAVAANDHSVKMAYGSNSVADNVRMWTVNSDGSPASTTTYPVNTLYKTTTWDENNPNDLATTTSRAEEFRDLQGKVVLKRSYKGTATGSETLSIYYVYDDFDLLRVVIPPLANGDAGNVATVLNDLCYQYTYDERKRMTMKKLPGADPVYMIYDQRDRLVAVQDGVQRGKSPDEWTFTKYDALNRPVMTGIYKVPDGTTPVTILATVNGFNVYSEERLTTGYGYTNNSFPANITESDLLTVTYYDTYGYPGVKTFNSSVKVSNYSDGDTTPYYFDRTKGQVTGSRVKVLDGTENNASGYRWLVSTSYYDDDYRVIQTLRDLFSTTTTDNEVVSTLYDFPGKVIKTQTRQVFRNDTNTVTETSRYDHAGRLMQVKHKVKNGTDVNAEKVEYEVHVDTSNTFDSQEGNLTVSDSYDVSNANDVIMVGLAYDLGGGQTFTANIGGKLKSINFGLAKTGSPTGYAIAKIYAMSGTYGTDGICTGSPLATSDPFDVATIDSEVDWYIGTFTFSGVNRINLVQGNHYAVVLNDSSNGDADNHIYLAMDSTSPTHSGNSIDIGRSGNNWPSSDWDVPFSVSVSQEGNFTVSDSYDVSNANDVIMVGLAYDLGGGQTFTANIGGRLKSIGLGVQKTGLPTGYVIAKIYAMSGTSGIDGICTGSPLAVSDNIDVDAILDIDVAPNWNLETFTFSGVNRINLVQGNHYVVVLNDFSTGDADNHIYLAMDSTSPTHSGNSIDIGRSGTNWPVSDWDVPFSVSVSSMDPLIKALSATDSGFTAGHPFASDAEVDYTVQSALSVNTYYWRARAIDPLDNQYGSWSDTQSFIVSSPTAPPVVLNIPANLSSVPGNILASMEYNEIGQLKQKSLNGEVGNGIQNLNYSYNIRGWLEKINNPDVNPSSTSTQKLNLGLYYNSVPTGMSATAQYNGNISGLVWNTPLQTGALSPADKQGYGFTYDGLNRMRTSTYGEGTTFATNAGANNENLAYDKNGNILTLARYKKGTGLIDNLTYTYKSSGASNMLDRVDDAVTGTNGFSELVKQANEYGYDGNGNLIKDDNKGHNSILYNYLNLPKRVGTTSQYILYVYDATGTKLAKVGTGGAYTYYAGDFVYSGSSLTYIMHREGMYLPGGNYEYYLKDHLGNTRLVINTSGTGGTVVQQTDYYPFGMDIAVYNGGLDNKYRYNGKEIQEDVVNGKSLQWYDYVARFYDPVIGHWPSPDPRAEKYFSWSPYNYAADNPILYIDPKGDTIIVSNTGYITRNDKTDNLVYMQGKNGNFISIGELGKKINANTIYKNLLAQNMKTAKGIWSPFTFKSLVQNKGEWDLKNNMKTIYGLANHYKDGTTQFTFQGKNMEAQDLGNHHFGAVGQAYGFFSEKFMLQQAGAAQMSAGTSKPEWQRYQEVPSTIVSPTVGVINTTTKEMLPPYGDDPRDQQWINSGFDYYDQQNK